MQCHLVNSKIYIFRPRWATPTPIGAPTFPGAYVQGLVTVAQPVMLVNPGVPAQAVQMQGTVYQQQMTQQMTQQNVSAVQYPVAPQGSGNNVVYGQVVQASVMQHAAQIQTAQVVSCAPPVAFTPVTTPANQGGQAGAAANLAVVPVTNTTIQGVGAPAQLSVTYVHPLPDPSSYQTMPMPDPHWVARTPGQQQMMVQQNAPVQPSGSGFSLNPNLTSQQQTHLLTAQPGTRQDPVVSLPELETTRSTSVVTQSARL